MGKPVRCRRWSATVGGDPEGNATSRDSRALDELRLSRHTDRGSEAVHGSMVVTLPGLDREARDHDPCTPPGSHYVGGRPRRSDRTGAGIHVGCGHPSGNGHPPGPIAADADSQTGRPVARRPLQPPGLHSGHAGVEPARPLLHRAERAGPVGGQPGPVGGPIRAHLPAGPRRPVREVARWRRTGQARLAHPRRRGAGGRSPELRGHRSGGPTPGHRAEGRTRCRSLRHRGAGHGVRGRRVPTGVGPGRPGRRRGHGAEPAGYGHRLARRRAVPRRGVDESRQRRQPLRWIAGLLQRSGHQLDGLGHRGPRRPGGRHPGPGRQHPRLPPHRAGHRRRVVVLPEHGGHAREAPTPTRRLWSSNR